MNEVELSSENVEPPDWLPNLVEVARYVYSELGRSSWDVGVLLCDDKRISELNQAYRHVDGPTDVLTFSSYEDSEVSANPDAPIGGDVAISLPTVSSNAEEFGVPLTEELLRVYVHALLHLAGFTHEGVDLSSEAVAEHPMLGVQERLVAGIQKELDS